MWIRRLGRLSRSLQACAGMALLLVAAVAAAVIAVATRAGLAARREAIEIVHGLGATDGYIAARFAGRATLLAATGGVAGALLALPVLLTLAILAAPFAGGGRGSGQPGRGAGGAADGAVAGAAGPAGGGRGDRLRHRPGHGALVAAAVAMTRGTDLYQPPVRPARGLRPPPPCHGRRRPATHVFFGVLHSKVVGGRPSPAMTPEELVRRRRANHSGAWYYAGDPPRGGRRRVDQP